MLRYEVHFLSTVLVEDNLLALLRLRWPGQTLATDRYGLFIHIRV